MREFFRIIAEQADHMRGLIGDLLDVGRIDTGTLSVYPEPVEVATLVERARNTFLSGGVGTACIFTCRRTCRLRWPTGGASSRC